MSELVWPVDEVLWPSLGGQVCDWICANLVHGPGDIVGEDVMLSDEHARHLYRLYEVHPTTGRRRFHEAGLMEPKGYAKTELGGWIAAAELLGPVRCDGFDAHDVPVGVPVVDPVIFLAAWSGGQSEELAYNTLKVILEESELADDLNITEQFVERIDGHGKVTAVTRSPNRMDGSRVTFQLYDETHRWVEKAHHTMYRTMQQNAVKRQAADAWSLSITTAFVPGRMSTAEELADKAKAGTTPTFYFHHRYAADSNDLTTQEGREAAVIEARTPELAAWMDVERIAKLWENPDFPHEELEQYWLCRTVASADQVFSMDIIKTRAKPDYEIGRRATITVGFDGSRTMDSTAFVITEVETGFQELKYLWERPVSEPGWEVPADQVEDAWLTLLKEYRVKAAFFDPRWWEVEVARWCESRDGKKAGAKPFYTEAYKQMSAAIRTYVQGWKTGQVTYNGNRAFTEHLANARKYYPGKKDPEGEELFVMSKDRKGSPHKLDIAMSGCLSWAAYIGAGAGADYRRSGSRPGRTQVKVY